MPTATALPPATAGATTDANASGRGWGTGPYVRKDERDLWNTLYEEFSAELRLGGDYPQGVALNAQQIDTAAYNCAYRAIWALRED